MAALDLSFTETGRSKRKKHDIRFQSTALCKFGFPSYVPAKRRETERARSQIAHDLPKLVTAVTDILFEGLLDLLCTANGTWLVTSPSARKGTKRRLSLEDLVKAFGRAVASPFGVLFRALLYGRALVEAAGASSISII